jgi:hypothetical protein
LYHAHRVRAIIAEVQRFPASFRQLRLRKKFFDSAFYRQRYPDVAAARMQPFLLCGV